MVSLYILDTDVFNDDSVFNSYLKNVSNFRKEKINNLRFRKDRNLSLGAAVILDIGLQKHGMREKDITYELSETGKPSFREIPELYFSVSHAGHYVAVAFSESEIGCDIEQVTKIEDSVKQLCLSDSEIKTIRTDKEFFYLWSMKESYLKATGKGITDNLKTVSEDIIRKGFQLTELDIIDGYSLAVCHREKQKTVTPIWPKIENSFV